MSLNEKDHIQCASGMRTNVPGRPISGGGARSVWPQLIVARKCRSLELDESVGWSRTAQENQHFVSTGGTRERPLATGQARGLLDDVILPFQALRRACQVAQRTPTICFGGRSPVRWTLLAGDRKQMDAPFRATNSNLCIHTKHGMNDNVLAAVTFLFTFLSLFFNTCVISDG